MVTLPSRTVCKIRRDKKRLNTTKVFNVHFTMLPLANRKGEENFSILGRNFVSEDKPDCARLREYKD